MEGSDLGAPMDTEPPELVEAAPGQDSHLLWGHGHPGSDQVQGVGQRGGRGSSQSAGQEAGPGGQGSAGAGEQVRPRHPVRADCGGEAEGRAGAGLAPSRTELMRSLGWMSFGDSQGCFASSLLEWLMND